MLWKKDNTEKKLNQINEALKKSFSNVKRDTVNIFQWLSYFYKKNIEQEQMLKRLQMELSYMPKTREDIRKIIDDYYSFETIMARMRDLNEKVDELSRKQAYASHPTALKETHPDISYIEKRLEKLEQRKHSMKEKIIKRIAKSSKDYVKSIILSYIKKYERISALQLKDIVVDEQNFCSKSSFYRLLEEIEELEEIGVVKHGKEKHYITKAAKQKII